jgi:tetratricopeptide (TPR) repeat protein
VKFKPQLRRGRPDSGAFRFLEQADALYQNGQREQAVRRYDEAAQRWPNDPHVLVARGLAVMDTAPSESKEWLERAARQAWDDPRALVSVARAMTDLEDLDRARELATRVDALAQKGLALTGFAGELAWVHGMVLLHRDDNPAAALSPLRTAYEEEGLRFDHGRALIGAQLQIGEYAGAQLVLERELDEHPDDEYLIQSRDWLVDEGLWSTKS